MYIYLCAYVCVDRFAAASSPLLYYVCVYCISFVDDDVSFKNFVCLLLVLLLLLALFQFKHMFLVWQACETCNLNQKLKHCNKITLVSFSSSSLRFTLLCLALSQYVYVYVCVFVEKAACNVETGNRTDKRLN